MDDFSGWYAQVFATAVSVVLQEDLGNLLAKFHILQTWVISQEEFAWSVRAIGKSLDSLPADYMAYRR